MAFIEKSLSLLKTEKYLGYIIPNTILVNEFCTDIRKLLLSKSNLLFLINEGQVFKGAVVEALTLIFQRTTAKKSNNVYSVFQNKVNVFSQSFFAKTPLNKFLIHLKNSEIKLLNKIEQNTSPIEEYLEIWRGLTTGNDKKYLTTKKLDSNHKKIIQGKQIKRYFLDEIELYVNYLPKELDRPRPQEIFEKDEKIISKFVGKNLEFVLDTNKNYVINTGCVLFKKENIELDIRFFLGLLNSRTINFYFKNIFTDYRDVFPTMKSGDIERLPFPKINLSNKSQKQTHDTIVTLVTQMLAAKQQQPLATTDRDKNFIANQIASIDTQIDNLVYELYGLTKEEIKIVEGS